MTHTKTATINNIEIIWGECDQDEWIGFDLAYTVTDSWVEELHIEHGERIFSEIQYLDGLPDYTDQEFTQLLNMEKDEAIAALEPLIDEAVETEIVALHEEAIAIAGVQYAVTISL